MTAVTRDRRPPGRLSGDDLRVLVHRHLRENPMLTAFEVARALRLPNGADRVRRQLLAMEGDGEAVRHEVPRAPGDCRKSVKREAA